MFKHFLSIMLIGLALSVPVHAKSSYGPVRSQDTLWDIASQLKPKGNVTVQQTMLALYHKNPHAFDGNINKLFKGAYLKAPTYAEVRRYDSKGAVLESRRHNKYWKRGTQLPKVAPPKVPQIKDPTKASPAKRSVTTAKPVRKASAAAPVPAQASAEPPKAAAASSMATSATSASTVAPAASASTAATGSSAGLEKEIVILRGQLKVEEEKNQRLTAELKALQAKQAKSGSTPAIEEQVKQLKANLRELETTLDQKDNHIKTLQASLKSASEAIKSQHEDNMRLANKLREVSPASLPPEPVMSGKPALTLTGVQDENKQAATPAGETTVSSTDAGAAPPTTDAAAISQVWADGGKAEAGAGNPVLNGTSKTPANDVKSGGVRLTEMLGFKSSQSAVPTKTGNEARRSISPLALAIALISFLFIVALLWRALVQQRELRRIEAEEERMADRMRKRLEENSINAALSKREPSANLSASPELNA